MKTVLLLALLFPLVCRADPDENRAERMQVQGSVLKTVEKRINISLTQPLVVRDATHTKINARSVIALEFPKGAPDFPRGTEIRVTVDARGVLTKTIGEGGRTFTIHTFRVLEEPRKMQ